MNSVDETRVSNAIMCTIRELRTMRSGSCTAPSGISVNRLVRAILDNHRINYNRLHAAILKMMSSGNLLLVGNYLSPDKYDHDTNFIEVEIKRRDLPRNYKFSKSHFDVPDRSKQKRRHRQAHEYRRLRLYILADKLPDSALMARRRNIRGVIDTRSSRMCSFPN